MAPARLKNTAQNIFRQSLAACSIEHAFAKVLSVRDKDGSPRLLISGIEPIDLGHIKHIRVIAAGKAASAMLYALLTCLKPWKQGDIAGVLIAGDLPSDLPVDFQYFAGGHPLPNEASQAGARTALEMLGTIQNNKIEADQTMVFFLISGGASAMMELPLDASISLTDTRNFYRELVHCGASIAEINCVRKHFSAVKGGRLALAADGITNLSLLISDVPPGHLDALGSGPTLPDRSTVEQCREILARHSLLKRFSESVREFFESRDLPETPKPGILAARAITLLNSDDLAEAARTRAEALGFHTVIDNTCDDWDYRAAAEYLVDRLRSLRSIHPRICLISSGEVTVKLSSDGHESPQTPPGVGGRNQQFSLYAATLLNPSDASMVVLSAGSDGIDGNSQAAGAVVDEQTLQPLEAGKQTTAQRSLLAFDSYTFLEAMGATIVTGTTGNNLRDLRILIGEPL
jgi:hydroxypyruvate reductase